MKTPPLQSLDGKTHHYDLQRPLVQGNPNQPYYSPTARSTILRCPDCNWHDPHVQSGQHDVTPAKYKRWASHVDAYNIIRKLAKPPQPKYMGRWESTRKEGAVFIYRVDGRLPRNLKGWRNSDYMNYVRSTFDVDMSQEWQSRWLSTQPWLVIEARGYKSTIGDSNHVLGAYPILADAEIACRAWLTKQESKAYKVTYAEGTDWPEGIEAPLPSVEEYVQRIMVISQTEDYHEILDALREVNRGITQLELLYQAKEQLEDRLTLG